MKKEMLRYLITMMMILWGLLMADAECRALVVGIGKYDTQATGWRELHGDADVDILVEGLARNGFNRRNIITLKNSAATKSAIVKALRELAAECRTGDKVIFHFSGHGQPVRDLNGDEDDGADESIVPYDACRTTRYKVGNRFYQGEHHLIDDELNPLLNNIKKRIGKSGALFVSIDACFSAGIEMDPTGRLTREEIEIAGPTRGSADIFRASENSPLKDVPRPADFSSGGRLTIVTACKSDEGNFEYRKPSTQEVYGSLSYTLAELLERDADFGRWERYFRNKEYAQRGIIVDIQHPQVRSYK